MHVPLQHVKSWQLKVKTNVKGKEKETHGVFKWRYRSLLQILKTYGNPFEAHWEQLRRLQNFSLFTFQPPSNLLPPNKKGKMLNLTRGCTSAQFIIPG